MNKQCLWCEQEIDYDITLKFLLLGTSLESKTLCRNCDEKFQRINTEKACLNCGRQLNDKKICLDCEKWQKYHQSNFKNKALYKYNDEMKEFINRYKFTGDYRLRRIFQKDFERELSKTDKLVVPIPVSSKTMQDRGFNQVTGLIENIKYWDVLAVNLNQKTQQSHKNRWQRIKSDQIFIIKSSMRDEIKNKNIIIVDDIYTTGTTIRKAAKILLDNGAQSVEGLTLCHA
ncbi:ComF family protein [Apilactobacillus bombintestini]|uniref:ComF family protein n=1 Tax=Apilactobacillus bombintestini TaxID=2419772 RepID=A0A387ASC8_9LACO|nr:ComF family protein [Apilactobacillus bombintestini]AYF92873.1 ComF family protein [Apilactobacillus bombintestini]